MLDLMLVVGIIYTPPAACGNGGLLKYKMILNLKLLLMKSQARHSMNKYVQQDMLQMHCATS